MNRGCGLRPTRFDQRSRTTAVERTSRPDPSGAARRRSSCSDQAGGNCVDVAGSFLRRRPVRDGKVPYGPSVTFAATTEAADVRSGPPPP
ncbi:DUF397 domain-containing protein [Streptomyces sp. NPDC017991]|uniref:DUF397 domain-containing protein n=1 Tax=Streptomyces sp. NPDC017991 TaxID=3365026 RepID=UPI00378A380E